MLIAGATGYIGRAVTQELIRQGFDVVAVVRDASSLRIDCTSIVADVTQQDALTRAVGGAKFDVVVSCIASRTGEPQDAWQVDYQANSHLLAVAKTAGAKQFSLLSAICVQRPQLAFQRAKLKFEAELMASGVDYTIIRPTAFYKSLSGQVQRVKEGKAFLVFGTGTETACKPISKVDLASFIVDALSDPDARNSVLPIGGPGAAMTPREQGEMLFRLANKPAKFRRVPIGMFTFAIAALSPFAKWSSAAAKKAELARIGRYYATESMLMWDESSGEYDAAATQSTGTESLQDHYQRLLKDDRADDELGEHRIF